MNIVFLSPHFPPNYHLFCVHLKGLGATVLGLADEPYDLLHPRLKDSLSEYYQVRDMHNYDELLRACGYFTYRYGKIDRLDSQNEYWLETEAQLRLFVGDYMDENVYFNSPLDYLNNLSDLWYLERYRQSQIVVCAGQGAWEEGMLADAHELRRVLEEKGVPCWTEIWGHDVNHDWPWWRKMLPHVLANLHLPTYQERA
jgi:hypothetical protein